MKKLRNRWFLSVVTLILGTFILVGIQVILNVNSTVADTFVSDSQILYLVPEQLQAGQDVPGSNSALEKEGVRVVDKFQDLQVIFEQSRSPGASANSKIGAIILHQQSLQDVDPVWLRGAFKQGLVLAGINVKTTELAALLEDDSLSKRGWNDDEYKVPFYSYLGRKAGNWGGVIASGNNNLNPKEGSIEQFVYALRIAMKNLEITP